MSKKSLDKIAAAIAAKTHKLENPLVIHRDDAIDPELKQQLHLFRVVDSAKGNEPAHPVILNDSGESLDVNDALESLFDRTVLTTERKLGLRAAAGPITIQPKSNILTLNPGETFDETITVTIPGNATPAQADIYFLADTTGSMELILNAVKTGANNILTALNALGVDIMFGVGNYKDFASGDPFCFQHQVSPTNAVPVVTGAINTWLASGGNDVPEGSLFALDSLAVSPGGTIGWRAGSKRIIVWFGDAPGHDPICTAVSGAPSVTEASATAKLVAQSISVLAISTSNPGLEADPKNGALDYVAQCGPPGGLPGQATRITNATGGTFVTGINAGNIANTIINLVTGAVSGINNVNLIPSASIGPFVTSITPVGGYGPLSGDKDHVLKFEVRFTGIPCKPEPQIISGTLDVVIDGKVVTSKKVQITVPPCASFLYSVKFVCGVQPDCKCECETVQPGKYATQIGIHNYSAKEVEIRKRFVPVVLAGAPAGREPRVATVQAEEKIILPAHSATMDDCCRIAELLFGAKTSSSIPLTIGFLEITSTQELNVTAIYTASNLSSGSLSIDVEQISAAQHQSTVGK